MDQRKRRMPLAPSPISEQDALQSESGKSSEASEDSEAEEAKNAKFLPLQWLSDYLRQYVKKPGKYRDIFVARRDEKTVAPGMTFHWKSKRRVSVSLSIKYCNMNF